MNTMKLLRLPLGAIVSLAATAGGETVSTGGVLPGGTAQTSWWWALSSAAKVRPGQLAPENQSSAVAMRAARNEWEAVQVIVRSKRTGGEVRVRCGDLSGPGGATIAADRIEVLRAAYVDIDRATDPRSEPGLWPDPLMPVTGGVALAADRNHAFWIRLKVPREAASGLYCGTVRIDGEDTGLQAPLELTVYDFALPDRMSCATAFGFSPGEVFRYHNLRTEAHKRFVLEKYWANFAAHHISPYDPAPLDRIQVHWPDVGPPRTVWDDWTGLRIVGNEVHRGDGALLIYDDRGDLNVTAGYKPLIGIPEEGLRLRFFYRTAVPGHRFLVSLNNHDANREWMSGQNRDITLRGSGEWEEFDRTFTSFPAGASFVAFHARATRWTDAGGEIGLVWLDDLSLTDAGTGRELIGGGDFEVHPRTEPVAPLDSLAARFDFAAWDKAMGRAIDHSHFNSFRLRVPGLGGGTFHELHQPSLLGFAEDTPEYPVLLESFCRQMQDHLRAKGWLDEAYVYWFDEPSPDQYPFVKNGFAKLARYCPDVARMLTEQVEPGLVGGPNLWCPISNQYEHHEAEERRKHGERFWWYVCTGPKAPYTGLFIDHPAPEMRIWLWQTFKRNIEGILVWQTNYWNSATAYPDPNNPQDPYADPMSWVRGYSTPVGTRRPWGNGDGRFLYPPPAAVETRGGDPILEGPVDSIRWEHLRDGIEDYEYLRLLRKALDKHGATLPEARRGEFAKLLEVPETITRSLTNFAPDGAPIEHHRHKVARAIERLGE